MKTSKTMGKAGGRTLHYFTLVELLVVVAVIHVFPVVGQAQLPAWRRQGHEQGYSFRPHRGKVIDFNTSTAWPQTRHYLPVE